MPPRLDTQRPMSIAFVCHEYPPVPHGGIGTFTQIVARGLKARGHSVRVVGIYAPGIDLPGEQDDSGVQVYRLRAPRYDKASVRVRSLLFRQLSGWSRAGEIDLVEVPDAEGWAAFWPSLRAPVITRVHGSLSYFGRELGRGSSLSSLTSFFLERASFRRSDFWCAVSRYSGDRTKAVFRLNSSASAISFVPVDVPASPPFDKRSRNRVIYTGTLTPKKGIYSLARAWKAVPGACPGAELHIFGKGSDNVRQEMLGLAGPEAARSMIFHGHTTRPDVLTELQAARAAVFPSYAEAFAFAPLEAMATGCPTIYSLRTSGPEAIRDGQDGLLIDPDRPDDIANAIVRLLTDDDLARRVGRSGQERVREHFSSERIVDAIERFYRQCIAQFGR
jgi:glycosyltransferase involved in cell wall biosynthesis